MAVFDQHALAESFKLGPAAFSVPFATEVIACRTGLPDFVLKPLKDHIWVLATLDKVDRA